MNMRTIGIGIVAVALILAISMTASARPDPVGATKDVQVNSVRLGHFNGTNEVVVDHDGVALSTKQAQDHIYCRLDDLVTTTAFNVNIRYTDEDGVSQTVAWDVTSPTEGAWTEIGVSNLVDITHINYTSHATEGTYDATIYANLSKQTAAQTPADSDDAEGGYITEMNLDGTSQTVKWQGYYGEISGNIRLADEGGDYMFTWEWDSGSGGSVFAVARTTMPNFGVIEETICNITPENADVALKADGTWSQNGTDSVLTTFGAGLDNPQFIVSGQTVTVSSRSSVATLDGSHDASNFTEVLLSDQTSYDDVGDMIWTCIIDDDSENYTGGTSDYQMIVPAKDSADETTTYYFYVELL